MQFTINSKKLNRQITFSRPGSSYLFADLNGQSGTLGVQLCRGGKTTGDTLTFTGLSDLAFKRVCRNWYKAYIKDID